MASLSLDRLTPLGRLALKLAEDFSELDRISGQIERMEINSDSGLDRAVKLLNQFAQHGQSISDGVQEFSKSLQEARTKSETAAKIVAERAQRVQERKQQQNRIQEKLGALEHKVREVSMELSGFKKLGKEVLSPEKKRHMTTQMQWAHSQLAGFIETAQAIKEEAVRSNFKGLERDAQSILGVLQSSRRKLTLAIPTPLPGDVASN